MEKWNQFEHEMLDYDVSVAGFGDDHDSRLEIDLVARTRIIPDCAVISLAGQIDEHSYKRFQKRVMLVMASGFNKIIFESSELTYVSSIGMGSFPDLLKAVRQQGGGIVLLRPRPKVYDVFQLLGFSTYFPKMDSLEDAIRYFVNLDKETFPKVFPCPVCSKKLRVPRPGRFRCAGCQSVLTVSKDGDIRA